jgi:hypothetical protein
MKANDHCIGSPSVLMMTHPLRYLPLARHHAVLCSAGSKGYCAVKETLQNGLPGHTLLIECSDLRDIRSYSQECCLIYNCSEEVHSYSDHVPVTTKHLTLYSNCERLPPSKGFERVHIRMYWISMWIQALNYLVALTPNYC